METELSKGEALLLLEQGQKLTHRNFSDGEWVKGGGMGLYEFEDGFLVDSARFWADRQNESWLIGWYRVE